MAMEISETRIFTSPDLTREKRRFLRARAKQIVKAKYPSARFLAFGIFCLRHPDEAREFLAVMEEEGCVDADGIFAEHTASSLSIKRASP